MSKIIFSYSHIIILVVEFGHVGWVIDLLLKVTRLPPLSPYE